MRHRYKKEKEISDAIPISFQNTDEGVMVKADISHWDAEQAYPKPLWVGIMVSPDKTVSFHASHHFFLTRHVLPGDPPARPESYSLEAYRGFCPIEEGDEIINTPFSFCSNLLLFPRDILRYGMFKDIAIYFPDAEVGTESPWTNSPPSDDDDQILRTLASQRNALWNKLFRAVFPYLDKKVYKALKRGYEKEVDVYNLLCRHSNLLNACIEYPALRLLLSGLVYKGELGEDMFGRVKGSKEIFLAILNHSRRLYNSLEPVLATLPCSFWAWAKQTRFDLFTYGDKSLEWIAMRMAEISPMVTTKRVIALNKEENILLNLLLHRSQNVALYFLSSPIEFNRLVRCLKEHGLSSMRVYLCLGKLDELGIYINEVNVDTLIEAIVQLEEMEAVRTSFSDPDREEKIYAKVERIRECEDKWSRTFSKDFGVSTTMELFGTNFRFYSVSSTYDFCSYSLRDFTDRIHYYLSGQRRLFVISSLENEDRARGVFELDGSNSLTLIELLPPGCFCDLFPIQASDINAILRYFASVGINIDHVDVDKVLQNEWIFFDSNGELSTEYKSRARSLPYTRSERLILPPVGEFPS